MCVLNISKHVHKLKKKNVFMKQINDTSRPIVRLYTVDKCSYTIFFFFFFSENATKFCFANGTWNNYTNFEGCIVNQSTLDPPDRPVDYDVNSIIYFVGYTLSFTALVFAVFIFIYFK